MAEYTTRNRLVKQATNENKGTWGAVLNVGLIDTVDFAIDGVLTLALTGDVVLTTADGAPDEARARTIFVSSTGGATRTITIPAVQKTYFVVNNGANRVTVKTADDAGVIAPPGTSIQVLCTGSECFRLWQDKWGLLSSDNLLADTTTIPLTDGYDEYYIALYGVSQSGAPSQLAIMFSSDNVAWTANSLSLAEFSNASHVYYGGIHLPNVRSGAGLATSALKHLPSNNSTASDQYAGGVGVTPSAAATIAWRLSGGIKHVRFQATGVGVGSGLDAGSFEVWAK